MTKHLDKVVRDAQEIVLRKCEEAREAKEVWQQAQAELTGNMDKLSEMRKEDLREQSTANGEGSGGLFGGEGILAHKRRSVYREDRKRKKNKGDAKGKKAETPESHSDTV